MQVNKGRSLFCGTKKTTTMNFSDLPLEIQLRLQREREALGGKALDTAYEVLRYNATGTRYFRARRVCKSWADDKGNSMPFGGGSYWTVAYGAVQFRIIKDAMGRKDYELCEGKRFSKSANGTFIPNRVETKAQVKELLSNLEIFNN